MSIVRPDELTMCWLHCQDDNISGLHHFTEFYEKPFSIELLCTQDSLESKYTITMLGHDLEDESIILELTCSYC